MAKPTGYKDAFEVHQSRVKDAACRTIDDSIDPATESTGTGIVRWPNPAGPAPSTWFRPDS
jgi:hypothetical protein